MRAGGLSDDVNRTLSKKKEEVTLLCLPPSSLSYPNVQFVEEEHHFLSLWKHTRDEQTTTKVTLYPPSLLLEVCF